METKFREQETPEWNGKPPEWKRKWNQGRNETFTPKLKQPAFLPFWRISVDSKVTLLTELSKSSLYVVVVFFFLQQHDSSLNKEFWEHTEMTQTQKVRQFQKNLE